MEPRLTVVLPLKGRHLFTLRFLWHANKMRLPYRFLLADGQVNETVSQYLENSREVFPDIDVEYVRYPDDSDYTKFFLKMSDAFQRVRTPYAMIAGNDDFLGFNGIEQALNFLDANADYACASGKVAAFSAYTGVGDPKRGIRGKLNRLHIAPRPIDVSAALATERLRRGGLSFLIYYAVYRTNALATIWKENAEIDFSDLMLHEAYHAMRAMTLGKAHANDAAISYFSQIGASITQDPSQNWVRHLLRSRFTLEADDLIRRVAFAARRVKRTQIAPDEAAIIEQVRTLVESYFR